MSSDGARWACTVYVVNALERFNGSLVNHVRVAIRGLIPGRISSVPQSLWSRTGKLGFVEWTPPAETNRQAGSSSDLQLRYGGRDDVTSVAGQSGAA